MAWRILHSNLHARLYFLQDDEDSLNITSEESCELGIRGAAVIDEPYITANAPLLDLVLVITLSHAS